MKINIGCGREYLQGYTNIDISKEVKADEYLDIRTDKLPFKNDSVDEIYISGVLEQIQENEHLQYAMNECWRVLKEGGFMRVVVPHALHVNAYKDPYDCRRFSPDMFSYFNKDAREYKLYGSVYGFKGWEIRSLKTNDNGIITAVLIK